MTHHAIILSRIRQGLPASDRFTEISSEKAIPPIDDSASRRYFTRCLHSVFIKILKTSVIALMIAEIAFLADKTHDARRHPEKRLIVSRCAHGIGYRLHELINTFLLIKILRAR